ncbi:MAG: thiamine phosphate synthase, partial [Deltaproteobacteria bacterium]|nr:thiamine phosphate synthase [Deltaproteobacteria bacterium]
MQLILISSPESLPNEIKWVEELFKAGLTRFHLRKPEHSRGHLKEYLLAIDPVYYPRICLHTHLDLAEEFSLGGVHLNGSVRGDQEVLKYVDSFKKTVRLSASAHRLDELGELKGRFEYVFLSPVFDSLSKVGYCAGF